MDHNEYSRLKKIAENARAERERAQGALDTNLKRLKSEFGCNNLDAAEKKLAKLRQEATAARADFEEAARAFREDYGD